MDSFLENVSPNGKERNYSIAFTSFCMPIIWFFLPQLFSPLTMIKAFIFGETPPNANYYTLGDVAILSYFIVGCSLGVITLTFPNRKKLSETCAIIGVIVNLFSFIGYLIGITSRLERHL